MSAPRRPCLVSPAIPWNMVNGRGVFNTPVRPPSWRPPRPAVPRSGTCCPSQLLVRANFLSQPTSAWSLALCTAGLGPAARRRTGAQDIPEMGINSPHLGFTVPANNKVLVTPTRDSPLWPPYFRQTDAGILGRAPHRAPADFLPARPGVAARTDVGTFFFRRFCFTVRGRRRGVSRWFGPR